MGGCWVKVVVGVGWDEVAVGVSWVEVIVGVNWVEVIVGVGWAEVAGSVGWVEVAGNVDWVAGADGARACAMSPCVAWVTRWGSLQVALLWSSLWYRFHLIPSLARFSCDSFLTCSLASLSLFFLGLSSFLFICGACRSTSSVFIHRDSSLNGYNTGSYQVAYQSFL